MFEWQMAYKYPLGVCLRVCMLVAVLYLPAAAACLLASTNYILFTNTCTRPHGHCVYGGLNPYGLVVVVVEKWHKYTSMDYPPPPRALLFIYTFIGLTLLLSPSPPIAHPRPLTPFRLGRHCCAAAVRLRYILHST